MIDKYCEKHTEIDSNEQHVNLSPKLRKFCNFTSLPSPILTWIDQHMHGFITVWDENGTVIHVSNTIENLLGYTVTDVLGTKWFDKFSPEDTEYIKEMLDSDSSTSQTFYITIQDANGNSLRTENVAAQVVCENGGHYYVASTKDITDKKKRKR